MAPLRIETGRCERLDVTEQTCIICNTGVESEEHVLLSCSLHDGLREKLFRVVSNHVPDFEFFSNADKVSVTLGSDNISIIRFSAKTCHDIFERRRTFYTNGPRQANLCLRAFRQTNFNCACPAIQRGQGSGFLSEGSF